MVAEEETLESVTENRNLAQRLDAVDGITGALMAPQELELKGDQVCWQGQPLSVLFMDFNTDVLLALHRKHDLSPLIQAVREIRVINPRGTEPINVKSSEGNITAQHARNFLDCIRSRKMPNCDVEEGHRSTAMSLLAKIAWLTRSRLEWDPEAERITNLPEANDLLHYEYRKPWSLE